MVLLVIDNMSMRSKFLGNKPHEYNRVFNPFVHIEKGMKLIQISLEERVENIEKFLLFGFLAVASFNAIAGNTYFFGKNIIIFNLSVFFISFPLAIYYFSQITVILSGRYGESAGIFLQKHKSKLILPFYLILILISGLIMYSVGKEFKDIISSILLAFIAVVFKYCFDYFSKKKQNNEIVINTTIRKDSGNLLLYIYKFKIAGKEIPRKEQLLTETGWNNDRLNNAIQYLIESKFVSGGIQTLVGSSKVVANVGNITNLGIDIVEKQPEFKQNFGFTVNLGVLQINLGMSES
jgi:hypothetical protein